MRKEDKEITEDLQDLLPTVKNPLAKKTKMKRGGLSDVGEAYGVKINVSVKVGSKA